MPASPWILPLSFPVISFSQVKQSGLLQLRTLGAVPYRIELAHHQASCPPETNGKQALLSIFKKRNLESKDKETILEKCEVHLRNSPTQNKCRLVVRMICRYGVVKTYNLTYESTSVLRANFDSAGSFNRWTTPARTLRDVVDYFGARTDQLDWSFESGKVNFTSYTEKIADGRDIFKQPMHTSVAIEKKDFTDFNVQEGLHIGIMVRDFRAIVSHADAIGAVVTAKYSQGNRPMQIAYDIDGILSQFTLMTRDHSDGVAAAGGSKSSTPARNLSVRPTEPLQPRETSNRPDVQDPVLGRPATTMLPPTTTKSFQGAAETLRASQSASFSKRPSQISRDPTPPAPSASLDQDSLFFPGGEDEHFWDEYDNDTAEQEDFVTWDASGRGSEQLRADRRLRDADPLTSGRREMPFRTEIESVRGIPPTQRRSQFKGLFD
jgi:cell cycle checkpoint control protein RAD9A